VKTVTLKAKMDSQKLKEETIQKMMRMLLDGVNSDDINFS
jgi:hypothetical protein